MLINLPPRFLSPKSIGCCWYLKTSAPFFWLPPSGWIEHFCSFLKKIIIPHRNGLEILFFYIIRNVFSTSLGRDKPSSGPYVWHPCSRPRSTPSLWDNSCKICKNTNVQTSQLSVCIWMVFFSHEWIFRSDNPALCVGVHGVHPL